MNSIQRIGITKRWSDVVIHARTAYFVEVADEPNCDVRSQIQQVLNQIDARLALFGSHRSDLIQVLIYLADLTDGPILNELWDAWVTDGHPPSRACVQAGLSPGYKVEMVLTAAVHAD